MKSCQVAAAVALAGVSFASANALQQRRNDDEPTAYSFDEIKATSTLEWQSCFKSFTCAKIEVPLVYEDASAGKTYVSFMKWTSNSTSANTTAQDIILNPGGLGGGGVTALYSGLDMFLAALGTDNNIVGMDPRGVNNSGPNLSCFPQGELGTTRLYHDLDIPVNVNDEKSYAEVYAKATAFGEFCTKAHAAPNDTAKTAGKVERPRSLAVAAVVLRATLRIALDGVVDGEDYYQGKWIANIADGDAAFRYFFKSCYDAGKDSCAFWADSPDAIEARFHALTTDLDRRPLPVLMDTPAIITISHLKMLIVKVPYSPLESFVDFANMLVDLEHRNGTSIAQNLGIGIRLQNDCILVPWKLYPDVEPRQFIACTDANDQYNMTYDAWVDHVNNLVNISKYLGEAWASGTSIACRKLDITAPKSQVFRGCPSAPKTNNPLFFLSPLIDPVTPLRGAQKMVARFGGAQLLIQDSVGHTTTASSSECTYGYLKKYFSDGSLPADETHCAADRFPFRDLPVGGASNMRKRGLPGF